jgi:hypothetical protein
MNVCVYETHLDRCGSEGEGVFGACVSNNSVNTHSTQKRFTQTCFFFKKISLRNQKKKTKDTTHFIENVLCFFSDFATSNETTAAFVLFIKCWRFSQRSRNPNIHFFFIFLNLRFLTAEAN